MSAPLYITFIGLALYFVFRRWNSRIPRGLNPPPGPPGHFLIGNLLDIPRSKEYITFNKWAKKYGDLVYLSVPGTSILLVNSYELAKELFDKKGNIYSNRYQSAVYNDLLQLKWTMVLAQYGERWRRNRTYFHQFFNQTAVENYHEVQTKYTKVLLKRLHQSPGDYRTHVRYIIGASILEITYGIQASSEEDPFFVFSNDTTQKIAQAGLPGTYLMDIFPILKHIPAWFPGTGSKGHLEQVGRQVTEMLNKPVKVVKDNLRNGDAKPSIVSSLIEQFENDPNRPIDHEDLLKHVPGVAYIAATDTTNGLLLQFFYTMLLYPEIQKRAQEELDEVIGSGALPSLKDFERLKYVKAIFQELFRWNPVVASGIPHVLTADDVVNGYFIPKGTIVFGNTWTLLRDESVYGRDADKFNPERFLNENIPAPDFAFGYGRRACPGRYFAENAIFMVIANVLHLFRILPVEGEVPVVEEDFDSGLVLQPKPFKCRIVPRSPEAIRTLEELDN